MRRFAQAFLATSLPLVIAAVMVAGLVISQRGGEESRVSPLPQTEDVAESEDTQPVTTAIAGVNALLLSLTGVGESDTATVGEQRVFLTRDPFDPVIVEDSTGGLPSSGGDGSDGGDADGGSTDDGGDGSGDGSGDGDGDGGGDGGTPDACSGDEEERVCEGRVVTVDAVDGDTATVVVDGVGFTVRVGDEFATSFRVLAIDAPCVTMLYGDERFTLCTGVTVLK